MSDFPLEKVQIAELDCRWSKNHLLITFVIFLIGNKFYPGGQEDFFSFLSSIFLVSLRFYRICYSNPVAQSKPVRRDKAGFNLNIDPSLPHAQLFFV